MSALVALLASGAAKAVGQEGTSQAARGPVTAGDGTRIGVVRATAFTFDAAAGSAVRFVSEVTVRGSVLLGRGGWCLQTRLLPGIAGNPARSRVIRLTAGRRVAIPGFTSRRVTRFVRGDSPTTLAAVTVRAGGCRGRIVARGGATTQVFE